MSLVRQLRARLHGDHKPLPVPQHPQLAVSPHPQPATPAVVKPRAADPLDGHLSPWDRAWGRLTDAERAPNSHECAHPGCTARLALAVLLCPDHRPRPNRKDQR